MNISSLMPKVNGRDINRKNYKYLAEAVKQLPPYLVGKSGLVVSDIQRKADKIENCGTSAVVGSRKNADGVEEKRVLEMRRCGVHKLCPVCADKVSGDRFRMVVEKVAENIEDIQYCYFLTFTVRDRHLLWNVTDVLYDGFRTWYNKGRKRGNKHSGGENYKIIGAIKSVEHGKGKRSGAWHPHIHAVVFTNEKLNYQVYKPEKMRAAAALFDKENESDRERFKRWMIKNNGCLDVYEYSSGHKVPVSKLSREWIEATGEAGTNVHVAPIFTPQNKPQNKKEFLSLFDDLKGKTKDEIKADPRLKALRAVKYSLKYSVKPGDLKEMTPWNIFELFDVMKKHRRTVEGLGFFRKKRERVQPVQTCPTVDETILKEVSEVSSSFVAVPLTHEYYGKLENLRELKEWCAGSEISTFTTHNKTVDDEIISYGHKVKEYGSFKSKYSPFVVNEAYYKLMTEDNPKNKEVLKHIIKDGAPPPEPVQVWKDEPNERKSPAYSAQYYYFQPERVERGEPVNVALWQLGADLHRLYQGRVAKHVGKMKRDRGYWFSGYRSQVLNRREYVQNVDESYEVLRMNVDNEKRVRDNEINERSGGLYADILQGSNCRNVYRINAGNAILKEVRDYWESPNMAFVKSFSDYGDFRDDFYGEVGRMSKADAIEKVLVKMSRKSSAFKRKARGVAMSLGNDNIISVSEVETIIKGMWWKSVSVVE